MPPDAKVLPSGLNASAVTDAGVAAEAPVRSACDVAASHSRRLASASADASSFPSGLNTMLSLDSGPVIGPAALVGIGDGEDRVAGGGRRREPIRLDREEARQLEVSGVCGLLGEQLRLRILGRVDGALALDQRENSEATGDGQARHERANDGVEPSARRLPAARDELGLLASRRRPVPVLATQPALGLPQVGAPEQVAAVALRVDPLADAPGKAGMLVAPSRSVSSASTRRSIPPAASS